MCSRTFRLGFVSPVTSLSRFSFDILLVAARFPFSGPVVCLFVCSCGPFCSCHSVINQIDTDSLLVLFLTVGMVFLLVRVVGLMVLLLRL